MLVCVKGAPWCVRKCQACSLVFVGAEGSRFAAPSLLHVVFVVVGQWGCFGAHHSVFCGKVHSPSNTPAAPVRS